MNRKPYEIGDKVCFMNASLGWLYGKIRTTNELWSDIETSDGKFGVLNKELSRISSGGGYGEIFDEKKCEGCLQVLPVGAFKHPHWLKCRRCANGGKDALDYDPVEFAEFCRNIEVKNSEKQRVAEEKAFRRSLHYRYGVALDWFDKQLARQGNRCACCGDKLQGKRRLSPVHHSHSAGDVLHILCHSCNIMEGFARNPERARRLWKYMLGNELFYSAVGTLRTE